MEESSSATHGSQPRHAFFRLVNGKRWTAAWGYVIVPLWVLPRNRMQWRWLFPKRRVAFPFVTGAESSAISLRKHSGSESRKFCCTAIMKRLILRNWRAKLISLLLATTLWYLIKKNVATTPSPSERPFQTPAAETR